LAVNYGSGSDDEGDKGEPVDVDAAAALKIPSPIPPSSSEEEEEVTQSDERASKRFTSLKIYCHACLPVFACVAQGQWVTKREVRLN